MKNMLKKIISITLIIILIMYTEVSIADNDYTVEQNQKQQNSSKIQEIEEREKQIENIKDETLKQVEKLNLQISQYENQIDQLDEQIEQTNTKIAETEEKLKKKEEDFAKQEKTLKARLVAAYEAGDTSYLDVLLASESLTDFISNYYLVTELATYDSELLDTIEREKQEIAEAKESLEQSKKELATQKANKQSASMQLQSTKDSKNKYITELSEEHQQLESEVEQLKKDNESLDATIKAKQAAIAAALKKQEEERKAAEAAAKKAAEEAARKAAQASSSSSSSSSGSTSTGSSSSSSNSGTSTSYSSSSSSSGFIKPVNSYVTTKMYYSWGGYHGAVDFGAAGVNGMPVYAVADGVVVTVNRWTTSYGNHILIAHSNGLYTLYAHGQAGSIRVSEGQSVKQGQQIMNVGSTGNSSGPHLHFEVRKSPGTYNCRVNPLSYLP